MRKISATQISVFFILFLLALAGALATTWLLLGGLPLGEFRGVALLLAGVLLLYLFALILYRVFLRLFPLQPGEIAPGSRQEFIYHVYLLFFLLLFYPVMRSGFVPVPLLRLFYLALGARLGTNTYSSGILFDPIFVEIGDNTLVGQYALVVPHAIEGQRLSHQPVRIGSNVTIGAGSIVLPGVTIGDHAIVSMGAVVTKGTRIGSGEIWGGIPARRIGNRDDSISSQ